MPLWGVLVEGSNILMSVEGKPTLLGFFPTRYVRAPDPEIAAATAKDLITRELSPKLVEEQQGAVRMRVENVWKERWPFRRQRTGFVFHPENADEADEIMATD